MNIKKYNRNSSYKYFTGIICLCMFFLFFGCKSDLLIRFFQNDNLSGEPKEIISFDFLAGENFTASLFSDVIGIVNDTTIDLVVPAGTDITRLIPDIAYNGESVSPDDFVEQDFSSPVVYTVTALDSTTKQYTVTVQVPSLSIDDVSVSENAGTAQFTVTLSPESSETVTVDYATSDIDASAGSDYTEITTTTLTFDPGETVKTIDVTILDDGTDENDETYNINLSGETNASISDADGIGTITDDDPATGDATTYTITGAPDFTMVFVEAGLTFKQGTNDDGVGASSATATVDNAFEIGQTEVTYELWSAVYDWATDAARGVNQYTFANPGLMGGSGSGSIQQPVTTVNWRDTMVWCNALTEYYNAQNGTSLECVYTSDAGYSTPLRDLTETNTEEYFLTLGELDNPYVNPDAKGFRLPTTTEWGAAARWEGDTSQSVDAYEWPVSSGQWWTAGDYASGAVGGDYLIDANNNPYAWYSFNDGSVTHDVATKTENALGLYDMSGNVYEWNFEWHPDYSGSHRVNRGGSCYYISNYLQVGYWRRDAPLTRAGFIGFRFVRTL